MRVAGIAASAMFATVVASCGGGSGPSTSARTTSTTPVPSTSTAPPSAPSSTAESAKFIAVDNRPAEVVVPSRYVSGEPAPLVIMLHGYTSSGAEHERYFQLGAELAERGIVYVHPDGTRNRDGLTFWNATDACCDFEGVGVDDAAYLARLIDEIGATVDIDPKRVFVVGHSNGGFMSFRMACDHADLVAAIVSLAGATYNTPGDCQPSEPVAILQIHGTADDTILYDGGGLNPAEIGGPSRSIVPYPGVEETGSIWADYNGCAPKLVDLPTRFDLDRHIDGPVGLAESTVRVFTDCELGGHVEIWTIPGGGHGPNLPDTFAATLLDFLLANPKP